MMAHFQRLWNSSGDTAKDGARIGMRENAVRMRGVALRRSARNLAREDGQAMIETAISLLTAIIVAFWLFEFSMFIYTYSVLNQAAHEGVRYAIVHGTDSGSCSGPSAGCSDTSGANVVAVVQNIAANTLHDMSAMTVNVGYPDATGSKPLSLVTVTVNYTFVPYFNLPGIKDAMQVTSQGRIIY
jgi:Flp pilus assembly protein TadG